MGGYAALTHQLGGEYVHLHGRSVASTLVDYIRQSLATEVIRRLSGVDVHILRVGQPEPA